MRLYTNVFLPEKLDLVRHCGDFALLRVQPVAALLEELRHRHVRPATEEALPQVHCER